MGLHIEISGHTPTHHNFVNSHQDPMTHQLTWASPWLCMSFHKGNMLQDVEEEGMGLGTCASPGWTTSTCCGTSVGSASGHHAHFFFITLGHCGVRQRFFIISGESPLVGSPLDGQSPSWKGGTGQPFYASRAGLPEGFICVRFTSRSKPCGDSRLLPSLAQSPGPGKYINEALHSSLP
jgi:hypothetical protein